MAQPVNVADRPKSIQRLSFLRKHLVFSQFSSSVFLFFFFFFSLATINRKISYDSGILRQDYGIIGGLPIGSPPSVHLPEWTGPDIALD